MNIKKEIELIKFFNKNLSLMKYCKYTYRKFINHTMYTMMFEKDSYTFIDKLKYYILFNDRDKEIQKKLILDMAYGRGWYKNCGRNNTIINMVREFYNN